MTLRLVYLIFALTTTTHSASIKTGKNSRVCSDGKTPLYEGDYNLYSCVYDCPTGFTCENQDLFDTGICCPDLDLLYEIYAEDQQQGDVLDLPIMPDMSDVPTVTGNEKKLAEKQFEKPVSGRVESQADDQPVVVQTTTPSTTLVPVTTNFSIITLSATRSSSSTTLTPRPLSTGTELRKKMTKLNCDRQPLEHKCNGSHGRQSTQYVVRWYKSNGNCYSYIYGFCPGTSIDMDQTLRTKDDCEELCLSKHNFQQSDLFRLLATGSKGKDKFLARSHALPVAKSMKTVKLIDEPAVESKIVFFKSSHDSSADFNAVQVEATLAPQKRCDRLPYRSMCMDSNLPSQFTIRWYNHNGVCVAYGQGYCHGETVFDNESLKSKAECERYCPGVVQGSDEKFDFATRLI